MYEKSEEEERMRDETGDVSAGMRDETWNVSVGMSYEMLSWLTGVVELTQRERSSSDEEDEYRDSLILLRLRGTYEWR
ncbi:MAG: hypothetical protein JRI56_08510 [Deltaproteobacteria bacterium]|nr:hypothetical protein [Deltaproteobacteria bacterium]